VKLARACTLVAQQDQQANPDIPALRSPYEHIQKKNDNSRNKDKLHAGIGRGFILLD
jgi:hypothetical protein